MERKKMLFLLIVTVLVIGGIPLASAGFVPGTDLTTKVQLIDASDPTATPVTYPDGQQYIELNDTYSVGETFTVWANVTSVTELNWYTAGVTYDDSILTCTDFVEGEFFYRAPLEYRTLGPNQPMPDSGTGFLGGYADVTWVLKKPGNVSGSGTLVEFDFTVVGWGFTYIDVIVAAGPQQTTLVDLASTDLPYNTIDIVFDNTGLVAAHELAVSLEAPDVVKPGAYAVLNATVENVGINTETNVEFMLLINGTDVNSTTITQLLVNSSYTIDYHWTPPTEATYNVTAYAVPVQDESDIENNVKTKHVLVPPSQWCISHPVVWDDVTYYVGTCSNGTVSDLAFSQPDKQILFILKAPWYEITGDYWCNVTIPMVLLNGSPADRWVLNTDGVLNPDRIVSANATHSYIYFVTTAGPTFDTDVDITGNIVIPEFPAAILLLLFMIATLVVVTLKKTNQPKRKNIGRLNGFS